MADNFPNPEYAYYDNTVRDLIDLSCATVGLDPYKESALVARRSIQFLNETLLEWLNKGIIQFTQRYLPVKLKNNVFSYPLPKEIYDVYDILIASMGRQKKGTVYSSAGGIAESAFDDTLTTSCQQTSTDGSLGIKFIAESTSETMGDVFPRVDFVGVLSAQKAMYELAVEGSNDNSNWVVLSDAPRKQFFSGVLDTNEIVWLNILCPQPYQYLQIRETGGSTLNISELYFMSYVNKTNIQTVDRSTYTQIYTPLTNTTPSMVCPAKNDEVITLSLNGIPQYLLNNQDYGTAGAVNNYLYMRAEKIPFSINYLHSTLDLNIRFQPALRRALSAQLAAVYAPEKFEYLNQMAQVAFSDAMRFDNDNPTLTFNMDSYQA